MVKIDFNHKKANLVLEFEKLELLTSLEDVLLVIFNIKINKAANLLKPRIKY